MKVFLSCVSSEFKSYRLKLANQLGALKDDPCEVKVQEDFQQGSFTLLEKLADYVRECDLVIHLVGNACGARPSQEHARTMFRSIGDVPPPQLPDLSYTQWEFHLAQRFKRKMLVYLAAAVAPRDCTLPVQQTDEEARLQRSHVEAILQSGKHYGGFTSYNTLVRDIFHDLGLEPELKINNLPYKSLGSLFKGREDFLHTIHQTLGRVEHLGHQRFAAITASATAAALYGLGGNGKTRTAIEYAHRYAEEYTALLFVRADSPAALQENLAALCGAMVFDLPEKNILKTEVQVAAVLRWLQQHAGWFLIFDNVDTEDAARAVEDLLGKLTPSGQVLVTSRLSGWQGAVESLALSVLEEAAAAAFLLERTQDRRRKTPDDVAQAHILAVELGHLALALEQAGAYIERYRYTFADYLAEWRTQHNKVLEWFDARVMQYPMSVAVTWHTSFDSLSEPARRLLRILAWLAPDPIPEWLLQAGGGPFAVEEEAKGQTSLDGRESLADLEACSLVTRADETATFTVHRLVQDVTRRSVQADSRRMYMESALRWVGDAFFGDPQDVSTWPVLAPLAPHALTLVHSADAEHIGAPTTRLMNDLGTLYHARAQYAEAEPLMRRALAIDQGAYGSDHPKCAIDLGNLAQLLQVTNRYAEAEPLMRQALAIDEGAYGSDHPKCAVDLGNLAQLLQVTNRYAEAEPLMRRALAIDEHAYAPDHPRVATNLNNLARLLQVTNRFDQAELLYRRALTIDKDAYGPEHPKVAIRLSNLGQLLQETSRSGEAEPLLRRALEIDEQAYGPDHTVVAGDLNNLALLLKVTNRFDDAEPLYRRALAISERAYGPDHSDVARDLSNLAVLLKTTNRLDEAEPLLRRAVEIFKKAYGPHHPDEATSLNNLGTLLHSKNQLKESELLLRRALAIDKEAYGPDHPDVARDLNNLAQLLQDTNRVNEAEQLMRRALEILAKFTLDGGHRHPRLRQAMINYYAILREQMGYPEDQAQDRVHEIVKGCGLRLAREGAAPSQ